MNRFVDTRRSQGTLVVGHRIQRPRDVSRNLRLPLVVLWSQVHSHIALRLKEEDSQDILK